MVDIKWPEDDHILCPRVIQNCSKAGLVSFDLGQIPSYISISSSSLSCLGSFLILFAYFTLKDIRTGAQKVITLLAVADFFTAFGYIIGSVNFLTHFNQTSIPSCKVFTEICEIQSYVTTWSTMSSYCWTCILAFYFFLTLVFHKSSLAASLIPYYNIISWLGPLLIVFPLLLLGKLGFAPYVASNWCYIKDTDFTNKHLLQKPVVIVLLFIGGKFWEVLSYIFVVVLYVFIRIYLSRSKKTSGVDGAEVSSVERRLLAIPILYIMLRMWGTLQFFYSLIVDHTNENGCIPQTVQRIYFVFGILQAIGDGGQGWGNAVLYIFFSPSIRRRLFGKPFDRCLQVTGEKLQELLETDTMTTKSVHNTSRITTTAALSSAGKSETTVVGGNPAVGYQVKSYNQDTTTTATTTSYNVSAQSHSIHGT